MLQASDDDDNHRPFRVVLRKRKKTNLRPIRNILELFMSMAGAPCRFSTRRMMMMIDADLDVDDDCDDDDGNDDDDDDDNDDRW